MPKVSVIMSVYNGETYLKEAIESILNQTFNDFEFIICDDGSTDNSISIINNYKEQDHRIIALVNKNNLGLAASLNKCLEHSTGEYIARMDCDDIANNERLTKQVDYLDKNNDLAFVGTAVNLFDDDGVWGERGGLRLSLSKIEVFRFQPISHPTTMIRKHILEVVGGYTVAPYTTRTEDYDLWCKIYSYGYMGANMPEKLLNYREDKNSYKKLKFQHRVDYHKLMRYWSSRLNLPYRYRLYSYIPLLKGVVPYYLVKKYHKLKFSRKEA